MNGGCGDDGFDYFRGWLIAQGREIFLRTLADPDSLADLDFEDVAECEDMLHVAQRAFLHKIGARPDDYDAYYDAFCERDLTDAELSKILESIHLRNDIDEAWDEEMLPTLLPKLSRKYFFS